MTEYFERLAVDLRTREIKDASIASAVFSGARVRWDAVDDEDRAYFLSRIARVAETASITATDLVLAGSLVDGKPTYRLTGDEALGSWVELSGLEAQRREALLADLKEALDAVYALLVIL
jgi:hypothetical protein